MAKKRTSLKALNQKWKRQVGRQRRTIQIHCNRCIYSYILLSLFYALDVGINALKQLLLG